MSEEMIIRHCSPTLAGLKTGSLFSCHVAAGYEKELMEDLRKLNRRLVPKGLRILPLRIWDGRALIYVYRPSGLKKDLEDRQTRELLEKNGYVPARADACVIHLIKRVKEGQGFPHEIGLFLGYPPEDVQGFIENKAEGHKMTGYWKVYGNEEEAKRKFEKFKKCTRIYCEEWEKGRTLEKLTVAG